MINDIVKYFIKVEDFWSNQQVTGAREASRGVAVKSWLDTSIESVKFKKHNKMLIKKR